MAQDSRRWFNIASYTPARGPKTAPRRLQGPFEPSYATLEETMFTACSFFVASDGLLRPQVCPKIAQESPKGSSRAPHDGPKSAQETPTSGPRGPQDAMFESPGGG
eukprot:6690413-Pyramimonas_sp.AAC.1